MSNGEQVHRVAGLALSRKPSVDFSDYRMDVSTGKAMDAMIAKVRNTLARQKDGTLASEKRADGAVLWRVA